MHPEVYVLVIPSFGLLNYCLSGSVANFIFGVSSMGLAMVIIMFFGSIVWAHHMFTVSMESDTNLYFSVMTIMIAIPTGTKIYNWLFSSVSYYHQSLFTNTASNNTLMSLLFILIIVLGGMTGVLLGNNILDLYLHDTYFVVAHFHYMLSLGSVFSIILTLVFLGPYVDTYLESYHVNPTYTILLFLFLNQIFIPLYFAGFNVMPRRIMEYSDYMICWNLVSSNAVVSLYSMILLYIL